ncbi:hypothetical protein Mmc1_2984 [Magnetococcus marinus MC-1]|uniref:Nucleotide-diphospho-sugar transferase domain-containing protein n=1 Tax=Magnetococcus marinus (strain ATCC BAA-1437 / JCM 17883 / MC-1) TaxID=156889 RepID=A0LBY2_MAGMM|nr:hypothetical protein [Magnetococcus marinus]ABK45475.1 hypothetical protein Mmc1_2984 [Magnetococcus marinus MC-1]
MTAATTCQRTILYAATGEAYRQEALNSARSLRPHLQNARVVLFSDAPLESALFDQVVVLEQPSFGFMDKISAMLQAPGDEVLFLDSDTHVAGSVEGLFSLLRRVDLAAAHAPGRLSHLFEVQDRSCRFGLVLPGVPSSFPEFNTGVILYRKTPAMHALLQQWRQIYQEQLAFVGQTYGGLHDQPSFRQAVWQSDLHYHVLTPEDNFRYIFPAVAHGLVRIFHGRDRDMQVQYQRVDAVQDLQRVMNSMSHTRAYLPRQGQVVG